MADISTAVSMARVPILGENGRISDDYIPAAIPEAEKVAQEAASQAKSAATAAEGSASAASTSATQASSSASAASTSATKAQQSAEAAGGSATSAKSAQTAAEAAKTAAESAKADAAASAQSAKQSASAAATSASSVADKFISSAQATTLEPGSQATASVENQVLTIGVPEGQKGDTPTVGIGTVETLPAGSSATATTTSTDTGVNVNLGIPKGDPGDVSAVQAAEGSDLSVSTDGGTVTIDDSALRERIAELENQAANVVTGTSTGYVAHGEDAFPQKPREVRIKGKTWVNRWPVIEGSRNGVTVSTGVDGLITLSGTATDAVVVSANVQGVSPNKQITVMPSRQIGTGARTVGLWVRFFDSDGAHIGGVNQIAFANGNPVTITTPSNMASMDASVVVYLGQTVNASFRVMLVDGTEAPGCFTPCASITSVQPGNLVTAGKNLIIPGLDAKSGTVAALTFFTVSDVLPAGEYTLSGTFSDNIKYRLLDEDGDSKIIGSIVGIALNGRQKLDLYVDTAGDYSWSNLQLEFGSTATAYEPPTVTQTPLPEVELRSLPNGTCDELVIKADGTCEVERRTQLVGGEVVALDTPTTEPQSPVTLPALPAPTFNQYHDSDVPSDTSTEYVRDINIVLDRLQAQVSATTVREATNG